MSVQFEPGLLWTNEGCIWMNPDLCICSLDGPLHFPLFCTDAAARQARALPNRLASRAGTCHAISLTGTAAVSLCLLYQRWTSLWVWRVRVVEAISLQLEISVKHADVSSQQKCEVLCLQARVRNCTHNLDIDCVDCTGCLYFSLNPATWGQSVGRGLWTVRAQALIGH